jgi:hypothetical protein
MPAPAELVLRFLLGFRTCLTFGQGCEGDEFDRWFTPAKAVGGDQGFNDAAEGGGERVRAVGM